MRQWDAVDAWMLGLAATWGLAFVAIKRLGGALDPYELTWFRYMPFLIIYGTWLAAARRAQFARLSGPDWLLATAAGILGVIGYHFPLNWGLSGPDGAGAGTGAILIATTPLWTLMFAVAARQERWRTAGVLGSLVAFAGVAVIVVLAPAEGADLSATRRALVILSAPVAWALYSIVARPLVTRHGSLFATGLTLCLGTLLVLPLGLDYGLEPLARLSGTQLAWMAFLSLLSTVGGYTVWNLALRRRSASDVAVWIYAIPVAATLAAWWMLDERVTAWFALGAALVLAGVVTVNRSRTRPAPPDAAPAPAASAR